jgi:tetratricopeptide (TPR) repeat protein
MARVPRLRSGCDIRSLPLTPAEAFLLSRMDAVANDHELPLVTGFTGERVAAMLARLAALGALEPSGPAVASASQTQLRAPPAPVEDAPTVEDIGVLRRNALARKLSGTQPATATPSIPMRAPTPPIPMRAPTPEALLTPEAASAQYDRAVTEARLAELARGLERGKTALARDDFIGAINAYRLALSLAEDDPRVTAVCNDAIRVAGAALAEGYWAQAVHEESEERWEEAALSYAKVCAGRPGDALAHDRVANAALRSANVRRGVEFARKAIELAPGTALYRVTLARAYAAAGLEKSCHGELARALELAPDDARIRNLVSRVRALFTKAGKTS